MLVFININIMTSDIRQKVHALIDEANDIQLNAVLAILDSSALSPYTSSDIDAFYKRLQMVEEEGGGYTLEEAHNKIRNRHNGL